MNRTIGRPQVGRLNDEREKRAAGSRSNKNTASLVRNSRASGGQFGAVSVTIALERWLACASVTRPAMGPLPVGGIGALLSRVC